MTTYIDINEDVRDAASLTVPADRTFRGAWSYSSNVVEVNMTVAKVIHKENLRNERAPRLAALDVSYMKALEAGSGADAVAASKTVLRNITADSRINAASTPEELIALDWATLLNE